MAGHPVYISSDEKPAAWPKCPPAIVHILSALLTDVAHLPAAIAPLHKMAFPSPGVSYLCFGTVVVLLLGRALYRRLTSPLGRIPGPFWARFTDLWRLVDHYRCTQIETQRRLHEQLGPAVRIGPNMVSLSDPELVAVVYSTRGEYVKVGYASLPCSPSAPRPILSRGNGRVGARQRGPEPGMEPHRVDRTTPRRATSTASTTRSRTASGSKTSSARATRPGTLGSYGRSARSSSSRGSALSNTTAAA